MSDKIFVPQSQAEQRFELTRSNATSRYMSANAKPVKVEDVHELCKVAIALAGQVSEGLAILQKDLNVTNDLIKRFYKVMPQHMTFAAYFEEVRNRLPQG